MLYKSWRTFLTAPLTMLSAQVDTNMLAHRTRPEKTLDLALGEENDHLWDNLAPSILRLPTRKSYGFFVSQTPRGEIRSGRVDELCFNEFTRSVRRAEGYP